MAQDWITKRAEQEVQRRAESAIMLERARIFQGQLTTAVHRCLDDYNSFFPGERRFIEITFEGSEAVIRRTGAPGVTYKGQLPEVRLQNEISTMVMSCTFPNHSGKDIEFKLVQLEDGGVGLAEGSLELACERILDPILFPELAYRI